jgi:hypothetical protein
VELRPFGPEECPCLIEGGDAPLRQQTAKDGLDFEDLLEVADNGLVGGLECPSFSHRGFVWWFSGYEDKELSEIEVFPKKIVQNMLRHEFL